MNPLKKLFDSFLDYEEEKMKGYKWASGFYVSNGILNYKKYSRKKDKPIVLSTLSGIIAILKWMY